MDNSSDDSRNSNATLPAIDRTQVKGPVPLNENADTRELMTPIDVGAIDQLEIPRPKLSLKALTQRFRIPLLQGNTSPTSHHRPLRFIDPKTMLKGRKAASRGSGAVVVLLLIGVVIYWRLTPEPKAKIAQSIPKSQTVATTPVGVQPLQRQQPVMRTLASIAKPAAKQTAKAKHRVAKHRKAVKPKPSKRSAKTKHNSKTPKARSKKRKAKR